MHKDIFTLEIQPQLKYGAEYYNILNLEITVHKHLIFVISKRCAKNVMTVNRRLQYTILSLKDNILLTNPSNKYTEKLIYMKKVYT
jgi:hypothetical protein